MSGPFSSVERMYKHKSTVCPAPAFCLFKPMHHKQTERDTLYRTSSCWPTMQLTIDLLQPNTTKSTTEYMQSDNWKQKKNCSLINTKWLKSCKTWKEKQVKVTACWLNTRGQDWCRINWLHQYPFSLLIDWRWRFRRECVVPVDAGGCLSFSTTLQRNWEHRTKTNKQKRFGQLHPSCRSWPHTPTHKRTPQKKSPQ